MPVQHLLHIDPDKLFEERTVSEIEEIHKKLQVEIERKREELRTMVGERYRDLIEAADTISEMKVTAEDVISHIEKMSDKCHQLQERHLLGFKIESNGKRNGREFQNMMYYAVAVQIKILMTVPEQIWSAVEKEDYLLGTELFLFARHINTGLQFQVEGQGGMLPVNAIFPIVSRQWSAINHFHWVIPAGCEKKLQCHNLSAEEAANFLCSLLLMEGLTSLQLLDKLLALRSQALESDHHSSVKSRVATSLKLLVHTVCLLHACFLDGYPEEALQEGRVWRHLKNIVDREAKPTVTHLDLQDTVSFKYLPAVIKDFRPSTREPVEPIPPSDMRDSLARWLDWVRGFTYTKVSTLLQLVGSLRGLQAVRAEAATVQVPDDWDSMCQHLLIPRGLDLWSSYFQPLLTARAKELLSQQWSSALKQMKDTLTSTTDNITKEKSTQPENDLRWFIWKERTSDLPLAERDLKSKPQQTRGLLMKTKGYSPCVEKLCSELDSQLEVILHDMKYYIGNGEPALKFCDREELQQHMQTASQESIKELIAFVHNLCENAIESYKLQGQACVVLMARFLQALSDLCPNLEKCVSQLQDNLMLKREGMLWTELCTLLLQESLSIWEQWRILMSEKLCTLITSTLGQPVALAELLHSIPQWDVVSIVEEGEEGSSVNSDIKVPAQPSLPLQLLLNQMCQELNAVAPHTLPRKVHQDLVEQLVHDIYNTYTLIGHSECIGQAQALQYLLDVKYILTLLVPREHKELTGKCQKLCDILEDKVDPFDLDVFSPYVQSNIKKCVQRTQGLTGVLLAWPDKFSPVTGVRTTSSSGSMEDPSVLPLSGGAPWFPLLPVTGNPGSRTVQHNVDKPQRRKTVSPKPKGDPTPGEIMRSGAAAFFGAMSSDWFGSG